MNDLEEYIAMSRELRTDGGQHLDRLSVDEVLKLLQQCQRREILRHLRDAPGREHSLDDVAAYLESVERSMTTTAPGRDHVLSAIVHVHAPKLEDAGLVDVNPATRTLHYYPNERVEALLDYVDEWADEY